MDLILWRHADAEALTMGSSKSDAERQLTPKGLKQAEKMSVWLKRVLPQDCRILVSPSQRTLQTVEALDRQFEVISTVGMHTTADQILGACDWPDNQRTVLVVGHQPHLGEVVCKLIPTIAHVEIKKANVWWISQKNNEEDFSTFIKAVMTPDLVG